MLVPWLIFIAVGLITYSGFLKFAARLLRYSVSWKSSFLFAGIMLVLLIFDHVLAFSQPVAIRIGHGVVLLLVLIILGSWFFSRRGTNPPRCPFWVVRRHTTDGASVYNDDCSGFRDRYSGSGFSQ
jgi:hypothetical protein